MVDLKFVKELNKPPVLSNDFWLGRKDHSCSSSNWQEGWCWVPSTRKRRMQILFYATASRAITVFLSCLPHIFIFILSQFWWGDLVLLWHYMPLISMPSQGVLDLLGLVTVALFLKLTSLSRLWKCTHT